MIRQVNDEPDYRFTLANERTFLAWQRTALGLLAAMVAMLQFVPGPAVQGMQYILSTVLGMLAIVSTGAGLLRWRQVDRAIRRTERLPHNRTPALLASGLAGLGLVGSVLAIVKAVTG
jgi:inner membrane protein YidH